MKPRFVSLILLIAVCCSCHRIKNKLSRTKKAAIEKVFPPQDNQKLFAYRFPHVTGTNIKVYTDYLGIDFKELYSFTISPADIGKIVAANHMVLAPEPNEGLSIDDAITWWDKAKMSGIRPYTAGKDYEYREFLWYDNATMQAWYMIYSL
jgi:hypothetical protein